MLQTLLDLALRFVVAVEKIAAQAPAGAAVATPAEKPKTTRAKGKEADKAPENPPVNSAPNADSPTSTPTTSQSASASEEDLFGDGAPAETITHAMVTELIKSLPKEMLPKARTVINTTGNAQNVTSIKGENLSAVYAELKALK